MKSVPPATWAALDGVTTNPSIIAKAGADFHERMAAICELCEGPVSAEVTATEHDAMLEEAEPLLEIGEQIVIKLPCTTDGIARLQQFVEPRGANQSDSVLPTFASGSWPPKPARS